MIIPLETLPKETVTAIIESFVLREGTEYGSADVALERQNYSRYISS